MPGANCSIFGCSTHRKKGGPAIFKIPSGTDDYNTKWRKDVINIVIRDRQVDSDLQRQIDEKRLHTCELHYSEDQLNRNPSRTTLIPGSLPTLNLPQKSFATCKTTSTRDSASIEKRELYTQEVQQHNGMENDKYKSLDEFRTRFEKLQLSVSGEWIMRHSRENTIYLEKSDMTYIIPKYQIIIESDLTFNILVYNWLVPKNNKLHETFGSSFKNVTLSVLVNALEKMLICEGVSYQTDVILSHTVSQIYTVNSNSDPIKSKTFLRPKECLILDSTEKCAVCIKKEASHSQYLKRKSERLTEPAKLQAPISSTSSARLKLTMQGYRIENTELKIEIETLRKKLEHELQTKSIQCDGIENSDLVSIMSRADPSRVSPFMKLFWEEQQKYLQTSSKSVRYHPMIIRYCLSLAAKSSSAYEDLRYNEKDGTGVLILPSQRRLRDYRNYIKPQRGFNKGIIQELKTKMKHFSDPERYVVLLLDEMKVQENLVWDKHTGELIGYVDLGDPAVNYATLQKVDNIATHVLVFMLRGIINPIKFSFANFATTGATGCQLFPLLWKAVSICESNDIRVLAVTCDGASSNRKLFDMHFKLQADDAASNNVDVIYRTPNPFSKESIRMYLYFFADPPHLIKTARNCLANSGDGKATRLMWNNGCFLMWNHIARLFYEDVETGLNWLPNLTYDHIELTPYSKMNVRLAAQVLSLRVSDIINTYGTAEERETAKFCKIMDRFFDIVNTKDDQQHHLQIKPDREPIRSSTGERLTWLKGEFLSYFDSWLNSIQSRPGNYDKTARNKMFISSQTYEGIKITVHSLVGCVEFLLDNHICSYVLSERFCQDPLENYFGRQRSMLSRKDNPAIRDVAQNDSSIRNSKVFNPISGSNVSNTASVEISNEPIHARKKARK